MALFTPAPGVITRFEARDHSRSGSDRPTRRTVITPAPGVHGVTRCRVLPSRISLRSIGNFPVRA